jgi:hypothetical protein
MRVISCPISLALSIALLGCSSDPTPATPSVVDAGAPDTAIVEGGSDAPGPVPGVHPCVRSLEIDKVEDLGAFSLPSPEVISRDGVSSGEFGGKILWTFGDTFLAKKNDIDNSSVLSATSGWSTRDAPLALAEPVNDAGLPAQLIPYTKQEQEANLADALNGWALWPAEAVDTGGDKLLVFFQRIKRTQGSGFDSVGVGTARIALDGTVAERAAQDLFSVPDSGPASDAGAPRLYGASALTIVDSYVFSYACFQAGFLNFACSVARVPKAKADDRAAWEFFDGTVWTSEIERVAPIIDKVGSLSISLNPYLGCYLAVTGGILSSEVMLRTSDRLESGWLGKDGVTVKASQDGGILEPVKDAYDYLFREHTALRSSNGKEIVISYARPTGPFRGDVRLARITLR